MWKWKRECFVMSRGEAVKLLAEYLADVVVGAREKVLSHILEGRLNELCPNVSAMTTTEVAKMIKSLNLAEFEAIQAGVHCVFVSLDDAEDQFYLVWDCCRMEGDDEEPVATFLLKEKNKKEQLLDFL